MLDEVQRSVVRPVQILEHQDQRAAICDRLDQALPGGEDATSRAPGLQPDKWPQPAGEPLPVAGILEQLQNRRGHLRLDVGRCVGFEHADVCAQRFCHGAERPAAVRERASLPPREDVLLGIRVAEELPDEPALPHARCSDERHELGRALVSCAREGVTDQSKLDVAPDEPRAAVLMDVHAVPRPGTERQPTGTGSTFPFATTGGASS